VKILLTASDRKGAWQGFDLEFVRAVSDVVSILVIAYEGRVFG
jgi:imidazole glycerol phosphate synthase subunit HisF